MNKLIATLSLVLACLGGCSEGSSGKADNQGAGTVPENSIDVDQSTLNALVLSVSGPDKISADSSIDIKVDISSMPDDGESYIVVSGYDKQQIKVSPSSTLIYPSSGTAALTIKVQDLDMVVAQELSIELILPDGKRTSYLHQIGLAD